MSKDDNITLIRWLSACKGMEANLLSSRCRVFKVAANFGNWMESVFKNLGFDARIVKAAMIGSTC